MLTSAGRTGAAAGASGDTASFSICGAAGKLTGAGLLDEPSVAASLVLAVVASSLVPALLLPLSDDASELAAVLDLESELVSVEVSVALADDTGLWEEDAVELCC